MKTRPDPIRHQTSFETLERRLLLADVQVAVIFQPADTEPPQGYLIDSGMPISPQADSLTYGWDRDLSHKVREAKKSSPIGYETFIAPRRGTWSMEVPDGNYSVTVAAGDGKAGRRQRIEVEEVVAVDARTSKDSPWLEATAAVTVTDGALTISPVGKFKGNRLVQVRVQSAGAGSAPPTAGAPLPGAVPTAIQWSEAETKVRQTRVEAAVATIGSRRYIMGGYVDGLNVNRTSDVLDAATGAWKHGPSIRGAETHAGVTSDGTRMIYKAGGQLGGGIPGTPTAEVWRLDTRTHAWKELPALPEARYAPGMAHLDGKLHVFGGTLPDRTTVTTTHWVLDLKDMAQGWQDAPALPEGGDHLSTVVLDGKIYAIGGEHGHATTEGSDAPYIQHSNHFRFDPVADAWMTLADLPVGRSHAEGMTIAVEGQILFMGGKLDPKAVSNRIDLYDPASDTWKSLDPLPAENLGGAAIYHRGRIYLSHGQIGGPTFTMHDKSWVGTISFA